MEKIKYKEDAQGNKKVIIKTDPETDEVKASCVCCGPCDSCPALEDVLTATSFIATFTGSGSPNRFGEEVGCRDGNLTIQFSLGGCYGPFGWDIIDFEGDIPESFGIGVGISRGSVLANEHPNLFNGDPSKCYVVLSFGGSLHFFLVSGENSVSISGTYNGVFSTSCYGVSATNCPGFFIPGDNGAPDECFFDVNATITIS